MPAAAGYDPLDPRYVALWLAKQERGSYLRALFDQQLAFVQDRSKAKAALCGRRSGKTEGVAAWLLQGGFDSPGETSVYIALTRNNCRQILWKTLIRVNRRHKLGLWFREVDGQLIVQLPNEHQIWLAGCKDSSEVEKFRGLRYRRAAVDEAGSFGSYLEELVEDALEPALMDLDGELALVGTPAVVPAGYFYEVTTGDHGRRKWPVHHWTVLDNPYMPHASTWLDAKRERNGWRLDHPRYLREYLGEWVTDIGALVYPYDGELNAYRELPPGEYLHCLGIDVGYVDSTAWVPFSWRSGHPELYIPESEKRPGLIPSAVAAHTEIWQQRYPGATVIDSGGLGKGYAEEMRQRFGLSVEPAEKQKKLAFVELFRGDLLSGTIKVDPRKNADLLDEWARIQWTEDRTGIDPRFEDHLADAALYAYRRARAWYCPQEEPPEPGSPEALARETARQKSVTRQTIVDAQRKALRRGGFRLR